MGVLLLAGCAPMRTAPPSPLRAVPVGPQLAGPDSLPRVVYQAEDRPGLDRAANMGFFGRLWHPRAPKVETFAAAPGASVVLPRKMRGSQVTVVIGNANDTRPTNQGNVKAPQQVATDSSTQNAATHGSDLAAANGKGSTANLSHTETEAPGALAVVANNLTVWVPWALGLALVLLVVFRKRLPVVGPFFS
jgi:hypothetical protein